MSYYKEMKINKNNSLYAKSKRRKGVRTESESQSISPFLHIVTFIKTRGQQFKSFASMHAGIIAIQCRHNSINIRKQKLSYFQRLIRLKEKPSGTYLGLSWAVVHPAHNKTKAAHWISLNLKEKRWNHNDILITPRIRLNRITCVPKGKWKRTLPFSYTLEKGVKNIRLQEICQTQTPLKGDTIIF